MKSESSIVDPDEPEEVGYSTSERDVLPECMKEQTGADGARRSYTGTVLGIGEQAGMSSFEEQPLEDKPSSVVSSLEVAPVADQSVASVQSTSSAERPRQRTGRSRLTPMIVQPRVLSKYSPKRWWVRLWYWLRSVLTKRLV